MSDCAASDSESYFLSYCRADGDFALRMAKDLRDHGVAMWVDQFDIRPSEHWDRAIERALRCSRGIVVIVSPRSVESDNVMDEIAFAIASGKTVLPVMIENSVLPLRIVRMHLIDATQNYEAALQQCVKELQRPRDGQPPGEASTPARQTVSLEAETLSEAKNRLLPIIGPIAGILVDKAAKRAASAKELQELLVQHIDNEEDRRRFIGSQQRYEPAAPPASPKPSASDEGSAKELEIPAKQLEVIAAALTRYVGPMAPIVAERERRACSSLQELKQRLASLIPADAERAEFLRAIGRLRRHDGARQHASCRGPLRGCPRPCSGPRALGRHAEPAARQ